MASASNFNLITLEEANKMVEIINANGWMGGVVRGPYVVEFGGGYVPPVDGDNRQYIAECQNGKTTYLGVMYLCYRAYLNQFKLESLALTFLKQAVEN